MKTVMLKIQRFDPEKDQRPHWAEYQVAVEANHCLLDALNTIKWEQDASAFLVQGHQRRVFNMVLHMLQDEGDASEITQEAFLAAWQGLPTFRREARFAT
jgi:Sigma-70 region 2/2Fe-2S iron-sulfur cluster binding domain